MTPPLIRAAARSAALTAGLLAVPLVAMPFTDEVRWDIGDFVAAAALLFSGFFVYGIAASRVRSGVHRLVIAALIFVVVATIWAELAVGLFR